MVTLAIGFGCRRPVPAGGGAALLLGCGGAWPLAYRRLFGIRQRGIGPAFPRRSPGACPYDDQGLAFRPATFSPVARCCWCRSSATILAAEPAASALGPPWFERIDDAHHVGGAGVVQRDHLMVRPASSSMPRMMRTMRLHCARSEIDIILPAHRRPAARIGGIAAAESRHHCAALTFSC